ncbi:hypothetical protein [Amycolatopsis sp. NPDC051102]|uniref:RICIN domain-containing protein n=1 Tax=Amycolatopsis sp. NPDC051102 TaxID=3155163 RepID=UPI00343CF88B
MRRSWPKAAVAALAFLTLTPMMTAAADPDAMPVLPPGAVQGNTTPAPPVDPPAVDPGKRDELLGQGWQRSGDRLWTTSSDASGFHVLVAEAKTGYTWRTAATLGKPNADVDQWIGNACVTGSGQRAVVVYAPRRFTNKEALTGRGGLTAVVDLTTGAVTNLPVRTSLAYYNPGCGAGETAALTQEADEDLGKTGVLVVDAATGKLSPRKEFAGQVTSATPTAGGFVVADRLGLLKAADNGDLIRLVKDTGGVPSGVRADSAGGVVFMDRDKDKARVFRVAPGAGGKPAVTALASGKAGALDVGSGAGQVFITGQADTLAALPAQVRKLDIPATSEVSTLGEAAVTHSQTQITNADPAVPEQVHIEGRSTKTGKALGFSFNPGSTPKPRWSDTTDPARTCSVPRNNPAVQVYQPKPKQVEWAADMAVKSHLYNSRPANWNGNGISAYTPQGMFPPVALSPGGQVPAQILLGILGQESNLWQASRYALPGETGNALIGNYYGLDIYDADAGNDWDIHWDDADCGYGVSQITDGMRLAGHAKPGETLLSASQQIAAGTDYAANVAVGLQVLVSKWNQMQTLGMTVNNNDPTSIENWFYATWAYNSGYHNPGESGANGAYGLGWLNNPANPRYSPSRHAFGSDPHDFAHPQQWPYEEKVLGFASYPPSGYEAPGVEVPFFRPAQWLTDSFRATAVPAPQLFCIADTGCQWGTSNEPQAPDVKGEPYGPCAHKNSAGLNDLKCWVHSPVTFKANCARECGFEKIRYDYPDYAAEQANGTSYPPACNTVGLAGNALTVDDVPGSTHPIQNPNCNGIGKNYGSFDFAFAKDANGFEASKIDLHQLGGGYGSHFWFSHTRGDNVEGRKLQITGTWTFDAIDGLARVKVHVPDHMADGGSVTYTIDTANGPVQVYASQVNSGNRWMDLGVYPFSGVPKVHLSTIDSTGDGTKKVAWDAAALEPAYGVDNPGDYNPSFRNFGSNLCLMLHGNTPANGAVVEQRTCTAFSANYWHLKELRTEGSGTDLRHIVQIVDRGSYLCLTPAGGSTASGAAIVEATCNVNDTAQQWSFADLENTDPASSEGLDNVKSGLIVGPKDSATTIGAPMTQRAPVVDGDHVLDDTQWWFKTMSQP